MSPFPISRRWDWLEPPSFVVPLTRPGVLLIVDHDPTAAYHALIHGYIDDRGITHALCDEAWALEGGYDAETGERCDRRRGYVEGPKDVMAEIVRSLRICERMCTECADRAVGALERDPVARPHPARAAAIGRFR